MRLLRRTNLANGRSFANYEIDSSASEVCKKIFELPNYTIKDTLCCWCNGRKQPINGVSELVGEISYVFFSGEYEHEDLNMCVSYWNNFIRIASTNGEVIDKVVEAL